MAKKFRKPKPLYRWDGTCRANASYGFTAMLSQHTLAPADARRLAKWLLKFADWAEYRRSKVKHNWRVSWDKAVWDRINNVEEQNDYRN